MSILRNGLISAAILALSLGVGPAFAQSTPGTNPDTAAPAAKTMKPMKKTVHKISVSKSCSTQAHKKNLHGKALGRFETNCMHHSGA
jgi:hypothetical protein